MSRICWDTMLFIYLLEDNPSFSPRVRRLLDRSYNRGDQLFTSYLTLGEVMAGADKLGNVWNAHTLRETIREMGFVCLPFGEESVAPFGKLRSKDRLKVADAIHLACAASAGIDLFLTGDDQLTKLDVPGIQFIAEFNTPIL